MKHYFAMSNFIFLRDAESVLKWGIENNFAGVEIWAEVPYYFPDSVSRDDLKKLNKYEKELEYSVHMPIYDTNLASVNPGIRRETLRQVNKIIQWKEHIDIKWIVIHAGKFASTKSLALERSREELRRSLDEICNNSEKAGVKLYLENIGINEMFYDHELEEMLKIFRAYRIDMCMDTGHANISSKTKEIIKECSGIISSMHIHDNKGAADMHAAAGKGNIDWDLYKELFKKENIVIVHEVRENSKEGQETLHGRSFIDAIS